MERKLYRSRKNRVFLGVCASLGEYYGIDPAVVRVIAVLVTVVSSVLPGVVAYFILALIIPLEGSKARSSHEAFRENLNDLEKSTKNIGSRFKNDVSNSSTKEPESPQHSPGSLPSPTRTNRSIYIIAIILIAVGLFFFILKLVPGIWQITWPLTLVVAGIIIVILVLTRNRPPEI